MKQIVYVFLLSLLLVSCGFRSGHFKMEGRLLHINQGELYVYSPDGAIEGMDTIKIQGGRFTYEIPSQHNATLVIVFPNYSTQPIFTEPGEAVEVKADASHLKEMEVEGTDDNELMTKFRKQVASVSPPEELKYAIQFVKDHPESAVSVYLTEKYLIQTEGADYKKAAELVNLMAKEQPKNGTLARLKLQLKGLKSANVGTSLPNFSAKDLNGKTITGAELKDGTVIINVWASWSYESMDIQRTLNEMAQQGQAAVIGICLDATTREARDVIKRDNISFPNICDGQMMESKLIKTLGLNTVPDNIVVKNGKIAERRVNASTFRQRAYNLN
ncbi:TlpA disulfide reductase family protein [Prevotella sp. HUN102]|uniref:TlpA disulfide reductase family protein n=1 Tax=Prevotella sp. HUN102 TaxID=1392486 RepID=UPI00048D908A|nr:TlpA disulfide reductase family protein [Prevotella sp. HUN102]